MVSEQEYRTKVIAYGRAERGLAEMPLEEPDFWRYVIRLAARPGRSSEKAPFVGAAAESLLRQELQPRAVKTREGAALELLTDQNPRVRRLALDQVAEMSLPESIEGLKRLALGTDKELAIQAVRVLAHRPLPQVYEALAEVLAGSSDVRTTIAQEELARAGVKAIPMLEKLLESRARGIRWRAVSCLVAMNDSKTLGALLQALHDDSVDITWIAADGLLALGPGVREEVLRSVLAKQITIASARALRHYAEHSSPRSVFHHIVQATEGLASLSAVPVAVERALEALQRS